MIKLNGQQITPTIFPDKTSQVWKLEDTYFYELVGGYFNHDITWEFESEAELIHLAQLVDLLRATDNTKDINLHMPYFPYARQDKEISNTTTFAKSTFIKLLNVMKFNRITSLDIHSGTEHGPTLWNHISKVPIDHIRWAIRNVGPTLIVFPDEGAERRYSNLLGGFQTLAARKVRNQSTGEITGLEIDEDELSVDDRVLIVDDICDGGRTFIEIAGCLTKVKEIHLYTTHGIYSKGTQVLRDAGIQRIFNYKGEIK